MSQPSFSRPRVSVIIPVYNGGPNLARCLQALAQAQPPPGEIIVVTDGATDDSGQLAQAAGARVIKMPLRHGPAHARNIGARAAGGDILFFLDADVLIRPDAVGQVLAAFDQDPALAAVFGSYDDAPAAPGFLSQYRNLLHHYVHQTSREDASTFWSGCGAIRREVFSAIGGFSPGYRRPAIEDIELGYRLNKAGCRIRLCKELQVKHLKEWTAATLLQADFYYRALPWTELILRQRRFINDLNLRTSSRLSVILVYGLVGALIGACWLPQFAALAMVEGLLLLALNAPFYNFLRRKRGLRFALQAIPWHWLYYAYSGLAFALGTLRYLRDEMKSLEPAPDQEELSWTEKS